MSTITPFGFGGDGGGGSGGIGTADILIEEIGVKNTTTTLTTDLFWVATGIHGSGERPWYSARSESRNGRLPFCRLGHNSQ